MKTTTAVKICVLNVAILLSGAAQANFIELGYVTLTGNFTLNHKYNFNQPTAFPFGTFGTLTVQNATGIFAPHVSGGDILGMNTPFMFGAITPLDTMIWSIGGYTVNTQDIGITGADSGRTGSGIADLSGNGFDPSVYGLGAVTAWSFIAPPYDISNFHMDITGPITLGIGVAYDNGHVPETGATLDLFCVSLLGLLCARRFVLSESRERRKIGY